MRSMKLVVALVFIALCGVLAIQMIMPPVAHAATSYTGQGRQMTANGHLQYYAQYTKTTATLKVKKV